MYNFTNLRIRAYDPDCRDPQEQMGKELDQLEQLYAEAVDDQRLLLLEPDVYYRGLRRVLLDNVKAFTADVRWSDRILSAPESAIAALPKDEQQAAEQLVAQVKQIRERFARNARGEQSAEQIWSGMDVVR
jgi:hypothetical protein